MRDTKSQKFCGYFTYQIFMSEAFRALKPAARDILIQIYFEIKMNSKKKSPKKYTPQVTNRHEIKMPYRDIREGLGYSDKTIWKAFKQFMAHGFLNVVTYGGGCKGDVSIYEIKENWRKWKPGQIIFKIRKKGLRDGRKKKNKLYCR